MTRSNNATVNLIIELDITSPIIESKAINSNLRNSFAFRSQSYATTLVKLRLDAKDNNIYIDTGYGIILINKSWLLLELLDVYIARISILLKVRGVGILKYKTSEYIIILIYLSSIDKSSKLILVYFRKELYLVDSLRAKILIGNNIISLEDIVINLA